MGVPLIEEAEGVVESLSCRAARAAGLPEAPLADDGGAIAGVGSTIAMVTPAAAAALADLGPLPRIQAWPVCRPVISAARDGAQTVLPA